MTIAETISTAASAVADVLAPYSTQLDVQLLNEKAQLPTAGSAHAAGLDLYAAESKVIPARGQAMVDLGISMAVPVGHYGRVAPRSGLGEYWFDHSASLPRRTVV